jgi:Protein of unknown function (DUF1579)
MNFWTAAGHPPDKRKDAQSAYEPRSGPGAGQKYLETFVGDWEVKKTFYPSAGDPIRARGECRQTMIHDGRFLQSEFVFVQDGRKSTGMGLVGFDPASGQFTSVWTDSRSTKMSMRQSQVPLNGNEIELYSRSLEKEVAGSRRSRTISLVEASGDRIIHRQYAIAADGTERLMMELEMTRKTKPDPVRP